MLINKTINLLQLEIELKTAGININGLGTINDGTEIHTYDADGAIIDLPEEAKVVIDSHVPNFDPSPLQQLQSSDAKMARIAEDIVDVLVADGKIFPQPVLDIIAERKALREQLTTPVEEPTTPVEEPTTPVEEPTTPSE